MELTTDQITNILAQPNQDLLQPEADFPEELLVGTPRKASVLIPLFIKDNEWNILYIRRTEHISIHSGQVAFPGGSVSEQDAGPEMTALREASEEIGLKPGDVHILGRLQCFLTITNFRITPIVAQIPWPYHFQLSKDEVASIFSIPIPWLLNPKHWEVRSRPLPAPFSPINVIYYLPYHGEILWGVSARLTLALLDLLTKK